MVRAYLRLVLVLLLVQLGYYNRRDLFSHWVRKDQQAQRPCTHACCRGLRAHPDNYPRTKRAAWLKHASESAVADWYGRHAGDTPADVAARDQALAEMQRRDIAHERREAAEERRRGRRTARRTERAEAVEREWRAAERETKGNMLNRRGREAGINERTLFTGPESRVRKYASEELLNYFEDHPRPTEAHFRGQDTRIGYSNAGPRKRMTTEEAEWRDRYDAIKWDIEHDLEAAPHWINRRIGDRYAA
jgi:hypothetical protein